VQKGFESQLEEARRCANRGELEQALEACDRAIAADRLHAASHYLRATVLQEQGNTTEAIAGFKRALYLEPDFILAHFALGNLARMEGRISEAERHFSHTATLLRGWNPDDIIPESGGVTAATLLDTIAARAGQQKV
jgi:chemotaxis protein methyltransferase CheR